MDSQSGEAGERPNSQGEGEQIEASGDAIVIADAILRGFEILAEAVLKTIEPFEDEHGPPAEPQRYMDGTPIE